LATPEQVRAYQIAQQKIEDALMRDLDRIWQAIRETDNKTASQMLQSVIPQLINRYGLMAAAVAADWYEALTGTEAFLPDSYNEEAFQASTRWALDPLFQKQVSEADRKAALRRLTAAAVRHTRQHARNTIDGSVRRSGGKVRYARRVTGATTCDFCLMLASRGPVYGTVEDAGGASNRYHDNCDCVPVPVVGRWVVDDSVRGAHWEGQNPGYDFEELYEKEYLPYHHAGDTAEDVMERRRAVRRQAKQAEKQAKNSRTLLRGSIQFADNAQVKPHELEAAYKLSASGLNVFFRAIDYTSGVKNPDIEIDGNTWEIKAPKGSSKNTISQQFKRARKQSKRLVLDLSRCAIRDELAVQQAVRRFYGQTQLVEMIIIDKTGKILKYTL
jgi:hypothetical protein